MADSKQPPHLLFKQRSWSPDIHRDKEWQKLKLKQLRRDRHRHRRSKSTDAAGVDVTDDDVKELKACFDLGFGFDPSNDLDPKLTQAFPALELYAAVNRQYNNRILSRSSSSLSSDSSSSSSSPTTAIIDPSKQNSFRIECLFFSLSFLSMAPQLIRSKSRLNPVPIVDVYRWWSGKGKDEIETLGASGFVFYSGSFFAANNKNVAE